MLQDKEELYKLAKQEVEDDEKDGRESVRFFKQQLKLEQGFYQKSTDFFYWLYCRLHGKIDTKTFKSCFVGRMVKYNKKHVHDIIPNYTELILEYEKGEFKKKIKNSKKKKSEIIKISQTGQKKDS